MDMFHRIQTRLFFLFLSLILLTLGVSGLIFFTSYNALLYRSEAIGLENYLREAADVVSPGIAGSSWEGLSPAMGERLRVLSQIGRLRIRVLDSRGRVLEEFASSAPGKPIAEGETLPVPRDFPSVSPRSGMWSPRGHGMGMDSGSAMMEMHRLAAPGIGRLFSGDDFIGVQGNIRGFTLQVTRDTRSGTTLLTLALRGYALAALLSAAAAGVIAYLFGSRISGPVKMLRDAAVSMAEGNYRVRAPVRGSDEIAQLTESFNNLAAEQELRIAELQNERDSLRRFLMDASHELRTPLTSLLTNTEILLEKAPYPDPRMKSLQENTHESILRMKELVDRLLSMSRIQGGLDSLEIAEYSLGQICDIPLGETPFSEMGRYIINPGKRVHVDRLGFGQVLRNLVENGGNAGARNVYIAAYTLEDSQELYIAVVDDGEGIPASLQDQIDTPFVRGLGSSGMGIGLSIAGEIVRRHGGNITFHSPVSDHLELFPRSEFILTDVSVEVSREGESSDSISKEDLRGFVSRLSISGGSIALIRLSAPG